MTMVLLEVAGWETTVCQRDQSALLHATLQCHPNALMENISVTWAHMLVAGMGIIAYLKEISVLPHAIHLLHLNVQMEKPSVTWGQMLDAG